MVEPPLQSLRHPPTGAFLTIRIEQRWSVAKTLGENLLFLVLSPILSGVQNPGPEPPSGDGGLALGQAVLLFLSGRGKAGSA